MVPNNQRSNRTINRVLSLLDADPGGTEISPALAEAARLVVDELGQPLANAAGDSPTKLRAAIEHAVLREIFDGHLRAHRTRLRRSPAPEQGQ